MKRITRAGFTLMEVFLVVTIMFLLFVSMILVIQNSVARQRYEDSLTSFKDFLQRQYDEVQNVVIDDKGLSDFIKECDKQTQPPKRQSIKALRQLSIPGLTFA